MTLFVMGASFAPRVEAQDTGTLVGRVQDADTGEGVAGASVALGGEFLAITDDEGRFLIAGVPAGDRTLRVVHVAYGEFERSVTILEGVQAGLRIRLSPAAIELEPVLVEALSGEELAARSRGTRRNEITRQEIARAATTGGHLGHLLARQIPGIRLRTDQARSGEPVCIEFRTPVSLYETLDCKHPVVFLDGVRVSLPAYLYTSLPVETIQRMEVIPPGEAGVAYGTESRYGVILIETRTAADVLGGREANAPRLRRGPYDWSREPRPYPWGKVLGAAFLGSAAGLAVGYAVGGRCLTFQGISAHFEATSCSPLAEAGSRAAWMALPLLGAALGARYAGSTSRSRGKFSHALMSATLVAVPGFILALTTEDDGFGGSRTAGGVLLAVGVPFAATVADRGFRELRSSSPPFSGGSAPR